MSFQSGSTCIGAHSRYFPTTFGCSCKCTHPILPISSADGNGVRVYKLWKNSKWGLIPRKASQKCTRSERSCSKKEVNKKIFESPRDGKTSPRALRQRTPPFDYRKSLLVIVSESSEEHLLLAHDISSSAGFSSSRFRLSPQSEAVDFSIPKSTGFLMLGG